MVEAAKAQAAQERDPALAEAARDRSLSEAELRGLLDQQREMRRTRRLRSGDEGAGRCGRGERAERGVWPRRIEG